MYFVLAWLCVSNALGQIIPEQDLTGLGEGDRLALIIANGDYAGVTGDLKGPANDATKIEAVLTSLGFETTTIRNAERVEMLRVVEQFRDSLAASPNGSVGLFYYSGNGISQRGGDDYLLGVDSNLDSEADLSRSGLSYQTIVSQFSDLGKKGLIFALDTNRYVNESSTGTKGIIKGFARPSSPEMFEIWASQKGDLALDTVSPDGEVSSPFSQALSEGLEIPGADIRVVFAHVQSRVVELTEGYQYPDVIITTTAKLVLNDEPSDDRSSKSANVPLVQSSASLPASDNSLEKTLWEAALDLGTADAIRDFLSHFPDSVLSGNARLRLKALESRSRQQDPIQSDLQVLPPSVSYAGAKRVAFLIGNKTYAPNLNNLTNPHNDVDLIAERLRSIGFTVVLNYDATPDSMVEGLSKFLTLLAPGADGERPVAFFYYSGHGFAPESSGKNYLVPVGLTLKSETDLLRSLTVEAVVEKVQALSPAFAFYAFDACRNDPGLPSAANDDGTKSTDGTKGFSPVATASHSLIAYATALGEKAYDAPDADTGPYAEGLSAALAQPGLDASDVFKQAQRAAYYASGQRQVPWIADGLIDEVILNDPTLLAAAE